MVPFVYSGTEGRSCSELLRSPTELKRRTRSFSQHSLSNVPQTPPFFNVLPAHCAIPLLTDSPSVSTTHLGRVAMPANLTLLLLCGSMAIPLLTDSPSVSTTYLGRVAMPANLTYYYNNSFYTIFANVCILGITNSFMYYICNQN